MVIKWSLCCRKILTVGSPNSLSLCHGEPAPGVKGDPFKGLPGTGTKLPGTPPGDKLGGGGSGVEGVQGQGWRVQG